MFLGQDWDWKKIENREKSAKCLSLMAIPPRLERGTYCLEGSYLILGELSSNISQLVSLDLTKIKNVWDRIGTESKSHPAPTSQSSYELMKNSTLAIGSV